MIDKIELSDIETKDTIFSITLSLENSVKAMEEKINELVDELNSARQEIEQLKQNT